MSVRNFRPVFFAFLLLLFPAVLFSQDTPTGPERILFDAANRERVSERRAPLKWNAKLAAAARLHAQEMVRRERLSHQFDGEANLTERARAAGALFSMVAENVAEAPTVNELHIGWMNSIPHRENILNPKLTAIGIAVETRGTQFFAVQDFSTAIRFMSREEQEKKVGQLLHARGLRIAENPDDARKACDSNSGFPGARPMAILHFEAPDLEQLPEQFGKAVKRGNYSTAAVGACSANDSPGFSKFRIAVLLY
jgi:hypothetical protein